MFVTHTARATRLLSIVLISGVLAACGGDKPLATVDQVDLQRYAGTWYEIARLPQWFQRGCYDSTATYSLNDDGTVKVVNRCQREGDEASEAGTPTPVERRDHIEGHDLAFAVDCCLVCGLRRVASSAHDLHVSVDVILQVHRTPQLVCSNGTGHCRPEGLVEFRSIRPTQALHDDLDLADIQSEVGSGQ